MKAYVVSSAGEAPAIVEVDIPEPAPGEARIRVSAASINGFDLAVAAGYMNGFFEHRYPLVLGREFAGVVDALGDGVDGLVIGDRVIGVVSKPHLQEGAFAEYTTAIVESGIAHAPSSLTDAAAAGLAHTGSAALVTLEALGDAEGRTLLIGDVGQVASLVRDDGLLLSPVVYSPDMVPGVERIQFVPIAGYPTGDGLRKLADLVDSGALQVIVDREKSLDDMDAAFAEYMGDHKIGNIVVIVG
jgi:NADPH:quinone reductase-like Zn-dependent oxidoreductase